VAPELIASAAVSASSNAGVQFDPSFQVLEFSDVDPPDINPAAPTRLEHLSTQHLELRFRT
jgi:hypothetical protein